MWKSQARMIWQFIDSSGVGGAERHIATLAQSLRRAGQPAMVVLLAKHGNNPWLVQLAAADIAYTHFDGRFATVLSALRSRPPALLHTHGYKAGIYGRVAARMARVPVVSTFHSGERGPFPVGVYDTMDDYSSFLGQRIAVSARIQQRLPFGARLIPSYVATNSEPSRTPLPPIIAFAGRLSPEKGPDLFCELAARAKADPRFAGTEWHVWGDGPMRLDLEARYGSCVTFHGVATDMDAVWSRVGLLVMPSRSEGVPLAALEAAALGIPVLASRVGGLPTVVVDGRTGWLFQAGDLDQAMLGLTAWQSARQSDSVQLRRSCWEKARRDFSEARWLPEIMSVYRAAGLDVGAL